MQNTDVYRIYNVALSDTKLRSISGKPYSGPSEVTDGDGLSVRITPAGTITFQYRFRWKAAPTRITVSFNNIKRRADRRW